MIGRPLGNYRIVEQIAAGGRAQVSLTKLKKRRASQEG